MLQQRSSLIPLAILATAVVQTGCSTPRDAAVFVTKTSTSIADVDTTPASISIGYDRFEGYAGPRFGNDTAYPVASMIESNGSVGDRKVRQVFVGGNAALIATRKDDADSQDVKQQDGDGTDDKRQDTATSGPRVMVFATGTTTGLKLGFAEGSPVPNSLTIGYRRKEAALVPVEENRLGTSVLGSLSNDVSVTGTPPTAGASTPGTQTTGSGTSVGFGVEQFFATGKAAENLAGKPEIRKKFVDTAEQAVGNVEKYLEGEIAMRRLSMQIILCVNRLDDTLLERAWANVDDLQVFPKIADAAERIRRAGSAQQQRQTYYGYLNVNDAWEARTISALGFHEELVCRLASKT